MIFGTPANRAITSNLFAITGALAACVLLAACGSSGSPSNPTANEQSTKEASQEHEAETKTAAFARCMREHGIKVETPQGGNGRGAVVIGGPGANPESPTFQNAQAKCRKLLPDVGLPDSGPPASAQTLDKLVKISRCMRQHGISEFPDPSTTRPSNLSPRQVRRDNQLRRSDLAVPAHRRRRTDMP
jgi:hypothetical protein